MPNPADDSKREARYQNMGSLKAGHIIADTAKSGNKIHKIHEKNVHARIAEPNSRANT